MILDDVEKRDPFPNPKRSFDIGLVNALENLEEIRII
jgi:hypothetical protein